VKSHNNNQRNLKEDLKDEREKVEKLEEQLKKVLAAT
jgi:hypothetical protein